MGIYIYILVSIIIGHILIKKFKPESFELPYIIFISLQLIIISSLRNISVGQDTSVYVERFNIISNYTWKDIFSLREIVDFEIGYITLNKALSLFIFNDQVFLSIISLILISSISIYIYQRSDLIWMSLFLFVTLGFFGESMNLFRQMIAISILLPSIRCIEKREIFKFTLFVLVASLFHLTAISFFIIYPLSMLKINKNYLIGLLVFAVSLFMFSDKIIYWGMHLLGYQEYSVNLGEGSGVGMIFMLSFFLFLALIYRKPTVICSKGNQLNYTSDSISFDIYINILVVAIMINILAINFALAGRVMLYFTIHNIILLPKVISSIDNRRNRIFVSLIILSGVSYYYIFKLLVDDGSGVVPYLFM